MRIVSSTIRYGCLTISLLLAIFTFAEMYSEYYADPLVRAIRWGDIQALDDLCTEGYDINGKIGNHTVLTYTMEYLDSNASYKLMDLDEGEYVKKETQRYDTLIKMISVLLKQGADINGIDDNGRGIIHYAVEELCFAAGNQIKLLQFLVANGSDIELKTIDGRYAIDLLKTDYYTTSEFDDISSILGHY